MTTDGRQWSGRHLLVGSLLLGSLTMLWILAVPPSGGPDEPSHLVRSAALVRGDLTAEPQGPVRGFEVPGAVSWPPPNCYAFDEFAPASCATSLPAPDDDTAFRESRARNYPVWGHLLPGLGTLAPGESANLFARIFDAVVPVLLLAAVIVSTAGRGWLAVSGVLLAVTPLAWFSFAVVNPSGVVIAGGIAMWAAIATSGRHPDRARQWLIAAGFAALSLPRRDGFVWAGVVVALALLWSGLGAREAWRRLERGPQLVIAFSTVATVAYGATSDSRSTIGLVLVPLIPIAALALRYAWLWARPRGRAAVAGVVTVAVVAAGVGSLVLMAARPGGFDRDVLRIIVNRTGERLQGAVGSLGWLDTPIPATMMLLWFVALGALGAATVLAADRRRTVLAATIVVTAVVGSWVLEMTQGDPTGTYYQGRYYLPFLVGVPIVLATARSREFGTRSLGRVVGVTAAVVVNVSFAAAMRRWGVGNAGVWVPWGWDTYDTLLPPMVLLILHVAVTAAIGWWLVSIVDDDGAVRPAPIGSPTSTVS